MMSTTKTTTKAEVEPEIDFEAHYRVKGYEGIAWFLRGYKIEQEHNEFGEFDEVVDRSRIVATMVGDDRKFIFGSDEIEKIKETDFCRGCGQIGCHCEVWD